MVECYVVANYIFHMFNPVRVEDLSLTQLLSQIYVQDSKGFKTVKFFLSVFPFVHVGMLICVSKVLCNLRFKLY